ELICLQLVDFRPLRHKIMHAPGNLQKQVCCRLCSQGVKQFNIIIQVKNHQFQRPAPVLADSLLQHQLQPVLVGQGGQSVIVCRLICPLPQILQQLHRQAEHCSHQD